MLPEERHVVLAISKASSGSSVKSRLPTSLTVIGTPRRSLLFPSDLAYHPRAMSPPILRPARPQRTSIETLESRIAPAAFVVTTLSDVVAADGFVSLREAIQAANTDLAVNEAPAGSADGDSITFAPSLFG